MRALALVFLLMLAVPAEADLRVAVFTAELDRDGPGLLLRDILDGEDAQVDAVVEVIAAADPDILLLLRFDWDLSGAALGALADRLGDAGRAYPHRFALRPNSGLPTALDLDGDGRTRGPGDAQGYGRFTGAAGMAVLSRWPVREAEVRDFSALLWRDLPGARLPVGEDGAPLPSAAAHEVQRLAQTGLWEVPVDLGEGQVLRLLAFHASPPPLGWRGDRNRLRNRDELRFWRLLLDGALATDLGWPAPAPPFVLAGDANVDPEAGAGDHGALRRLVGHPVLQDPAPTGPGAPTPGATTNWEGRRALRTDYLLPSRALRVTDAGVLWPAPGAPLAAAAAKASDHRLVWVDLALDEATPGRPGR